MAEKHRLLSTDAATREGIKAPEIVEFLSNHIFGLVNASQTQVKCAEILLKKSLPDIQMVAVDVTGGVTVEVLKVASHAKPAVKKPAPGKKRVRRSPPAK